MIIKIGSGGRGLRKVVAIPPPALPRLHRERELFIDNLLVQIHFIIDTIWWTGLAPWDLKSHLQGILHRVGVLISFDAKGRGLRKVVAIPPPALPRLHTPHPSRQINGASR